MYVVSLALAKHHHPPPHWEVDGVTCLLRKKWICRPSSFRRQSNLQRSQSTNSLFRLILKGYLFLHQTNRQLVHAPPYYRNTAKYISCAAVSPPTLPIHFFLVLRLFVCLSVCLCLCPHTTPPHSTLRLGRADSDARVSQQMLSANSKSISNCRRCLTSLFRVFGAARIRTVMRE